MRQTRFSGPNTRWLRSLSNWPSKPSTGIQITDFPEIRGFIADWFARFDRLDPIDAFLPDLHPDVDWDMLDVDTTLTGHDRVRAWYRGVLETLQRPTEHHVSKIAIKPNAAQFEVLFRATTVAGDRIEARVHENWRFEKRSDGRPLITHYSAQLLQEADT
ncbi:nuclear transport factor 2 family protein [Ruegeria lacuscaerulensis]|nr:nuclear transport factor 2 family protein [Ruegeria lacuscaerulensis]